MIGKHGTIACAAVLGIAAASFAGFKWVERTDFDRMCAVATQGLDDPELANMDTSMRAATLAKRIQNVLYAPPAKEAFHAIALAYPEERMKLMKTAAEEVRGEKWDCPPMRLIFGPFKSPYR